MINNQLFAFLKANMGLPLTPELAAGICLAADQIPALIPLEAIGKIQPKDCQDFTFSVESIEAVADEIKPLHRAH
ncbi:hypothetical protein [Nitrosospira sp. NpAV]|uniref:hypothetical protein n=1 Tax=Nitrosospira sp. NpAV TaxID=58133 RepID=UPI0005A232DE|nr:hypothetical protein [Nitrosospira sp. NpAV]KIO48183.1 hypothetical protein SQ11_13575 [Nitrosospira sp. NpAV]